MATDAESFERSVRIPPAGDEFDPVRAEYSQMLKNQLAKGSCICFRSAFVRLAGSAAGCAFPRPFFCVLNNGLYLLFHLVLRFTLFKTGGLARSVLNAH